MTFRVASTRIWNGIYHSRSNQETEITQRSEQKIILKNIKYHGDWNNEGTAYNWSPIVLIQICWKAKLTGWQRSGCGSVPAQLAENPPSRLQCMGSVHQLVLNYNGRIFSTAFPYLQQRLQRGCERVHSLMDSHYWHLEYAGVGKSRLIIINDNNNE